MSWVLVAFFVILMVVSVVVSVWWSGLVSLYRVWRVPSKNKLGFSRLFLWGKKG